MIQHLLKKLDKQDTKFKNNHQIFVELLENEKDLEQEQAKLDDHDK